MAINTFEVIQGFRVIRVDVFKQAVHSGMSTEVGLFAQLATAVARTKALRSPSLMIP